MNDQLLSIGEAALYLGVSVSTLRRWERKGILEPAQRTAGGQRRYRKLALKVPSAPGVRTESTSVCRKTICYARVSTSAQRDDLVRQEERLRSFCIARGWTFELLSDVGSGLNYKKRGLQQLLDQLVAGQIERLVVLHKDRLLRFGAELVFGLCERLGVDVVVVEQNIKSSFEQELVRDMLELVTVFSARLYGARSLKSRQAVAAVKNALR